MCNHCFIHKNALSGSNKNTIVIPFITFNSTVDPSSLVTEMIISIINYYQRLVTVEINY